MHDSSLLPEEGGTSNQRVFIIFLNEVMSVPMHVLYIWFITRYIRTKMGREIYRFKRKELEDLGPSCWRNNNKKAHKWSHS